MYLIYLSIFVTKIIFSDAARILAVIPTPSISHQVAFRPLLQELAERGHQVVVLTTDPAFPKGHAPDNLTEIDVHDLTYKIWRENFFKTTSSGRQDDSYTQISTFLDLTTIVFEKQMQTPEMQEQFKDRNKFDLLLLESCVRPALVLSHIYKVPVIQIGHLGAMFDNKDVIGAPVHPILNPDILRQKINNLTIWDKLMEIYNQFNLKRLFANHQSFEERMLKRIFGPDTPSLSELINNVHMLFLNIHPIWEGNSPVPPTVVYMGGIHVKPQKELPSVSHPKIKIFIVQGSLQSTIEAINAGVPLIGVPILGDQWYNSEKYVQLKLGLRLDLETLTEEKFKNAINTIIEDDSYRQNVVKLRELMKDQPETPLQRAVWWTEYVIRHKGARHLRSPTANITWSEYLELKLMSVVFLVFIFSIALFVYITKFICKKIFMLINSISHKMKVKEN